MANEMPRSALHADEPTMASQNEIPTPERTLDSSSSVAVEVTQAEARPVSLQELISLAGPLVAAYFQSESASQERELELAREEMRINAEHMKRLTIGLFVFGALVLLLAGWLMSQQKSDAAVDLIQLIAAVGGAGLGGYGVAKGVNGRSRNEE